MTYRVLPSGLTSIPFVVAMSVAARVALPSVPTRQTCPVPLAQFGSLAKSVPSGAMARSFGWFMRSSWANTLIIFEPGSTRSTLCPT